MVPQDLRFTQHHIWCRLEQDGTVTLGATEYALRSVGDIIYVDLPDVDDDVLIEVPFGEIEGVDGVHDLLSPFDGVVRKVNAENVYDPDRILEDPYGQGWLISLQPEKPPSLDNLLSASDYEQLVKKKRKR